MQFGSITSMSYHCWRQIKKFFTAGIVRQGDVHRDGERKGKVKDKLHKIRPFINILLLSFADNWVPGVLWAIDESIIPYFGRFCPIKVYMKDKPYKFGMKLWMLNDGHSHYCYKFKFYEGAGDLWDGETEDSIKGWTIGERVIRGITKGLQEGYVYFTDRFFTTPRILQYMWKERKSYVCGTAKKNARNLDKEILFKKSKKVSRGFFKWAIDRARRIIQVCWLDRTAAIFISNYYGCNLGDGVLRLTAAGMLCWHVFPPSRFWPLTIVLIFLVCSRRVCT